MSVLLEDMGKQLNALRETLNLSQRELAERVSMPQSHISKIENGQVNLSAYSLFQLVRSLEHEVMFIPRQEFRTVKALLKAKTKSSTYEPEPAYTPDKED